MTSPRTRLLRAATVVATAALSLGLLAAPASAAPAAPFGPDVSRWQHPNGAAIDWAQVKAGGSSFAIIKATEGGTYTNPYFTSDTAAARAAGLAVGAYHYARPALPFTTASDQANYFAAVLGDVRTPATLPPILDLETTGGLSAGQLVTWAQIFTETLRSATGRTPVIYTYRSFWNVQMAGTSAFLRSPLWLAAYTSTPPAPVGGWPAWSLWQHTSSARIPGVVTNVDMNRFAGDAAAFAAFADGTAPTDWPVTAPAAPVKVRASAGVRSASVRWIPADDGGSLPTSYTVTMSPGGAQVTVAGTSTTAAFTGLTEGAAYSFTVSATNTAGASPLSLASPPMTARGDAPAAPTGLLAEAGRGSVELTWDPGAVVASSYTVSRCSPAPCVPTAVVASVPAPLPSYVDTAVVGGVTYVYAVASVNGSGSSATSAPVRVMPQPTVDRLDAPTGVVARPVAGALLVSWIPAPHAAKYRVLRCAGAGCAPVAGAAMVDMPATRIVQRVPAGRPYTYAVQAVAATLVSAPSAPATGTAPIPQTLRVTASPAVPMMGRTTTLTVRLSRSDTGQPLAARPVTLTVAPLRGGRPRVVVVHTSATGLATMVTRPQTTQLVSARSATAGLLARGARSVVRVKPVVAARLSATTAPKRAKVAVSGRTSAMYYGERVHRQAWVKGRWRFVASAPISRTGTYRFVVAAPATASTTAIRVLLRRTRLHEANASAPLRLTAR